MNSSPLVLERCQHGGEPDETRACFGEAGHGVYAYVPNSAMRQYYSAKGEDVYRLTHKQGEIVDFLAGDAMSALLAHARSHFKKTAEQMPGYQMPEVSSSSIQRYGSVIEHYVRLHHPDAVAYLVCHKGPGIPTGIQAVIRRMDAFEVEADQIISQKNIHTQHSSTKGSRP